MTLERIAHARGTVTLRLATLDDVPTLERWDRDPDVIAAIGDDPTQPVEHDWPSEIISSQSGISEYFIAELDGSLPGEQPRPIGVMQIIDAHREPTHYWGDIEPGLRAIDIWIGEPGDRGKGLGAIMMRLAFARSFAAPEVTAIVIDPLATNTRAHAFYERLGFVPLAPQRFGDDDCLVHRLGRATWRRRFPQD